MQGLAPDMHAIPRAPRCRNKRQEEFQPLSGFLLSLGLEVAPVSTSQSWATSLHLCSFVGDLGLIRTPAWTPSLCLPGLFPTVQPVLGTPSCRLSRFSPTLCDPTDCSPQAPLSMGFSRQGYWSGLLCPHPPGDLPNPGMELWSPAVAGRFFTTRATRKVCQGHHAQHQLHPPLASRAIPSSLPKTWPQLA